MCRGVTRRPNWECQRHGASVELPLHGVFRLLRSLYELLEVPLHARLLGKEDRQLLGHTARYE